METNTYSEGCFTMRKSMWSTVIALVVLFGMFTTGVLGDNITENKPSDQEIIEVMVFYEFGPETGFKVYDEYSNDEHIFYKVFDSEGHHICDGMVSRDEMVDRYF
ncbi:hypothetical protein [Fibrobacter sp.]|uniref:hypothetical protein n=1 Tax=Fibrobacter sp. TaxID=35828 RepID=UPI0038906BA7